MEQSQVDYLSLDVEGNELDILKTIPFDQINVKVTLAIPGVNPTKLVFSSFSNFPC